MPTQLLSILSSSSFYTLSLIAGLVAALLLLSSFHASPKLPQRPKANNMSRVLTKSGEKQLINEFRDITGISTADATKWLKKHKFNLNAAINAFFAGGSVSSISAGRENEKKIGEIWEKYKDPTNPKLIKIDGTLALCEELDIDPSADVVLFCLAADLGSKAVGEFDKDAFVQGWLAIDSDIDSEKKMKAALPRLRKKLNTDPAYFKKVYIHTFDLSKKEGARVLALDTAVDMWNLFIPPALAARPSALSHVGAGGKPTGPATGTPAAFGEDDLELWLDFQRSRGKAVSKDTWSLFIDFIRTIDAEYKDYDEEAAWPSTIDEFVEYAREHKSA